MLRVPKVIKIDKLEKHMAKKSKVGAKKAPQSAAFLEVSQFLKIVSDENRMKILLTLGSETMNVTDIYSKIGLPQNLTSHHITKLKSIDLLNEKRDGVFRNYSVNIKRMKELNKMFRDMFKI